MNHIVSTLGQVNHLRKLLALSAATLVATLAAGQAGADVITKDFEFGPDTAQDHSHMRTFNIPANSIVNFEVVGSTFNSVPLVIEVHRPDASSIGSTGPDGPLQDLITTFLDAPNNDVLLPLQPANGGSSYSVGIGCPSTWRVRVRTQDNHRPPSRVAGTIKAFFVAPDPTRVTIGNNQNIGKGLSATRTLSGIGGKGDGTIRLKAKWHADAFDAAPFTYPRLTVRLLRPDSTIAASQTGYSQHAPSDKIASGFSRVNFAYNLTAQDLSLAGSWKVKIKNNTGVNVVDFNIEAPTGAGDFTCIPSMPAFKSTFSPGCN